LPKIPEFLLRSLYIKRSLKNIDVGFEFQIKNELGPVRVTSAQALRLDRKPVPLDKYQFILGDTIAAFDEVSAENSVPMRKGESLTVLVQGASPLRGRHTLGIGRMTAWD